MKASQLRVLIHHSASWHQKKCCSCVRFAALVGSRAQKSMNRLEIPLLADWKIAKNRVHNGDLFRWHDGMLRSTVAGKCFPRFPPKIKNHDVWGPSWKALYLDVNENDPINIKQNMSADYLSHVICFYGRMKSLCGGFVSLTMLRNYFSDH